MLYCAMPCTAPQPKLHKRLTHDEWTSVVELYELGYQNQRQLAANFGVSGAAISKGLKRRGAIKGKRVEETLVELKQELARKWRAKREAEEAATKALNEHTAAIATLTDMLLAADRDGTLADLGPLFEELHRTL